MYSSFNAIRPVVEELKEVNLLESLNEADAAELSMSTMFHNQCQGTHTSPKDQSHLLLISSRQKAQPNPLNAPE